MSLTWHIVRKDFRRMRWPLAAWLMLPLAEWTILTRASGMPIEPPAIQGMQTMTAFWTGLTCFGGLILAAWLVMEDALVGTQAFWQSRPISPVRLLVAKTLGALLMFAVLPVLVMVPVWLAASFPPRDMAWCAVELALKQLMFTVAGVALAAVSESAGQLLVRMIVAAVAVPLLTGYCAGIFDRGIRYNGDGLAETRYRIVMGLFVLLPLVMIAHQYLTRRTRRTYAILGVGILLALGLRFGWSWDLSGSVRRFPEEHATRLAGITFTAEPLAIEPGHAPMKIFVRGTTSGTPAGSYIDFNGGRGWWSDAGGRQPGEKFIASVDAPLEPAAMEVVNSSRASEVAATWQLSTSLRDETVARTVRNASRLEIVADAVLMRGRVLGELPLSVGAVLKSGPVRLRITGVERLEDQWLVSVEQRLPWPPWSARAEDVFLLRNAGAATGHEYLGSGGEWMFKFNGVGVQLRRLSVPVPMHEVNGRQVELAGGREAARLVVVHFSPDLEFTPILAEEHATKLAP